MLLTIAELRPRVGLLDTDTSKDVALQSCYDIALSLVEDYLDRKIKQGTYTETFFDTRTALLKAYPVVSITTIDGVAPTSTLTVDYVRGIIKNVCWANNVVEYVGGWLSADIPLAISLAINSVFDQLWYSVPGFGLVQATAQAAGEVKRFSINGVSVEYFAASTTDSSSSSSVSAFIPSNMLELLKYYRRESMVGAG